MKLVFTSLFALLTLAALAQPSNNPLKVGVAGMTHGHVHWVLSQAKAGDIEVVGVSEANKELAERLLTQYGLPLSLWHPTLDQMLANTKPEAVTAFGNIYDHLMVVEKCAPLGIHVMVEKPLAVSLEHARKMKALADRHNIWLLTNYETTWYATTQNTLEKAGAGELGQLRKVMVNDGHQGPMEIGVGKEFLEWLIDPALNGAGALTDFGCYGANLLTHLMNNQPPATVTAVTQTNKPDKYPKVDDEATIVVTYPGTQGIIQASWNWTYGRKDMEVFGTKGYVRTIDGSKMNVRMEEKKPETLMTLDQVGRPFSDPFAFFRAVVRKQTELEATVQGRLSSLENNMIVMEILDAAMRSAREGKSINLSK